MRRTRRQRDNDVQGCPVPCHGFRFRRCGAAREPGLRRDDDRRQRGPDPDVTPTHIARTHGVARVVACVARVRRMRHRRAGCRIALARHRFWHEVDRGPREVVDRLEMDGVRHTQQQCLRDAITRAVPRGTRVLISQDQNTFLRLELAELSIPWVTPVDNMSQAAYEVVIVPGSECGGESLSAKAVR